MPEIETTRADVRQLKGLHLWHFPTSNCSQRVRLALAEKGKDWQSHIVDLSRNEQIAPDFMALNPRGLVPVLVHDGRTFVESNDIIAYLDQTFAGSRLTPDNASDREYTEELMAAAGSIQDALKLLSFEFLFKLGAIKKPAELEAFEQAGADPKLIAFHRELAEGRGFSPARITQAVQAMDAELARLEARLARSPWLSGSAFGLADVSWLVNVHRLSLMLYSFKRFPRLAEWLSRCMARPSSRKAIASFEKGAVKRIFWIYSQIRRLRGDGVNSFR
jgi:glutathione S-transferase